MARRTFSTIILAALLSSPLITAAAPQTELLPEVAAILQIQKPDEALLKQDGYVGLTAIDAPAGMDYMAIGSRAVLESFHALEQALVKQDMGTEVGNSIKMKKYYGDQKPLDIDRYYAADVLPCVDLNNHGCISQTLALKEEIAAHNKRYAELKRRYLEIQKKPYWKTYGHTLNGAIPDFRTFTFLSSLWVDDAILAFEAGEIDKGFDLLNQEMRFKKAILASNSGLLNTLVAIGSLSNNYHVISELLDCPSMQSYLDDKRLAGLLQALTEHEKKAISNAVKYEVDEIALSTFLFSLEAFQSLLEEEIIRNQLPDPQANMQALAEQIDREKLANILYLSFQPIIKSAAIPIQEAASRQTGKSNEEMFFAVVESQFALPENAANSAEKAILMVAPPSYQQYVNRLYNLQIYQAMVQTKLRLLQSGIDTSNTAAVTAFLAHAELQNPYTHQPFNWDSELRVIWTQRLSDDYGYTNQKMEEAKEQLTVRVL